MFFGEALGNPNDGGGVESGGVGEELAEVAVIGALDLILDEYPVVGIAGGFTEYVGSEGADVLLYIFEGKFEPDGIGEEP